jgi:predicted acyl esterase
MFAIGCDGAPYSTAAAHACATRSVVAVPIAVLALGGCDADLRPARIRRRHRTQRDLTTSDAVALVADIYRPKMNGAAPTILVRIPFSRTFRNSLSADAVNWF